MFGDFGRDRREESRGNHFPRTLLLTGLAFDTGVLVGLGLMYALDPVSGELRRASARRRSRLAWGRSRQAWETAGDSVKAALGRT